MDSALQKLASAPLAALREPLQCYGGLDGNGERRPDDEDVDFACQCYIPFDPKVPAEEQIGTSIHFLPLHRLTAYR